MADIPNNSNRAANRGLIGNRRRERRRRFFDLRRYIGNVTRVMNTVDRARAENNVRIAPRQWVQTFFVCLPANFVEMPNADL